MANITFQPPLRETVRVRVPSYHTRNARLRFSATFTAREYAQYSQDGAKLQLWTDAPTDRNHSGQWSSYDFQKAKKTPPPPAGSISLLSNDWPTREPKALTQHVELAVSVFSPQQYVSFTYRVVHLSGEIQWLGGFGENGVLDLQTDADKCLSLTGNWASQPSGGFTREGENTAPIARYHDSQEYEGWAFENDGVLATDSQQEASILFVLPRNPTNSIFVPGLLVFAALSPVSSVSLDSRGVIAGRGSVLFTTVDSLLDIQNVITPLAPKLRLIANGSNDIVILASSASCTPVTVAVIPTQLNSQTVPHTVEVDLASLIQASSGDPTLVAISSPGRPDCSILKVPDDDASVSLIVGPSGGRFAISPGYNLATRWSIHIASPYTSPTLNTPTPPPLSSPLLQPVSHVSQTPSVLSPTDLPPSAVSQPNSETQTPDKSEPTLECDEEPTQPESLSASSLALRPHPAVSFSRYLAVILLIFLKTLATRIFESMLYRDPDAPNDSELAAHSTKVHEDTPPLHVDSPPPPSPSHGSNGFAHHGISEQVESPVKQIAEVAAETVLPPDAVAFQPQLFVDVAQGHLALFANALVPDASIDEVKFKLNNAPLEPSDKSVANGVFFFTFKAEEAGHLVVHCTL